MRIGILLISCPAGTFEFVSTNPSKNLTGREMSSISARMPRRSPRSDGGAIRLAVLRCVAVGAITCPDSSGNTMISGSGNYGWTVGVTCGKLSPPHVLQRSSELRLRGGSDFNDPEVLAYMKMLESGGVNRWKTGVEQWEELGYGKLNYWGGDCPEEDCRCRDPNAKPLAFPLPPEVHPSVLHKPDCICPHCLTRRVRDRQVSGRQGYCIHTLERSTCI